MKNIHGGAAVNPCTRGPKTRVSLPQSLRASLPHHDCLNQNKQNKHITHLHLTSRQRGPLDNIPIIRHCSRERVDVPRVLVKRPMSCVVSGG